MSAQDRQDMTLDAGQYLTDLRAPSNIKMQSGGERRNNKKTSFSDPSANMPLTQKKRKTRRNKTLEKKRKIKFVVNTQKNEPLQNPRKKEKNPGYKLVTKEKRIKFCNIRFFTNQSTFNQGRFTICAF